MSSPPFQLVRGRGPHWLPPAFPYLAAGGDPRLLRKPPLPPLLTPPSCGTVSFYRPHYSVLGQMPGRVLRGEQQGLSRGVMRMGRDGANGIISYQHLPCLVRPREWGGVLTVLWSLKFQERNLGSPYTYTQSVGLGPQGWDPSRRQQYKPRPAEEAWVRNAEGQDPGHQDVGKVVSGSDQWGYCPLPPEKLHATL